MPNWCHNTLTVSGEAAELARFIEAARPNERSLRRIWEEWSEWDGERPPFERYFADVQAAQPLSFDSLVPQPPAEELRKLETYRTCTMCGGDGKLATTEEEQLAKGGRWYPWMAEGRDRCNVCGGSGEERIGSEGWYKWRVAAWGTKWDASFSGPFLALGGEEMDVDASVEAQGATLTPTVAVYKFDTAWAPPAPFVQSASEQFPDLEFTLRYGEPGEGYAGQLICLSGLTIEDEELTVEDVLAPEEMWF